MQQLEENIKVTSMPPFLDEVEKAKVVEALAEDQKLAELRAIRARR